MGKAEVRTINMDAVDFIWFLVLVGIVLGIAYAYERKRSGELRSAAQALGLSFERSGSIDIEEKFGEFPLFWHGLRKRIRNRMWGRRRGIDVMIFRYEYTNRTQ